MDVVNQYELKSGVEIKVDGITYSGIIEKHIAVPFVARNRKRLDLFLYFSNLNEVQEFLS